MFKANGVDVEVVLKPLRYRVDDSKNATISTENNPQGEPENENNVEERKDDTI